MVQLRSVLVNQVRGEAPLTAPLTGFITPTPTLEAPLTAPVTPTPTVEVPLTAPAQSTPTPTVTPTTAPSNNNSGSSDNGGSNNGGGNSGGGGNSSNNGGGSNGGGGNVCRDERPKSAPIILSARATGANQVTLSWKKGWAPFNGYVISYGTKKSITQYATDVFGANTTVATVKGLNGNTTYFFRIQAKNGCVSGDYSREISVRTFGKALTTKKILGKTIKKTIPLKVVNTITINKKKK